MRVGCGGCGGGGGGEGGAASVTSETPAMATPAETAAASPSRGRSAATRRRRRWRWIRRRRPLSSAGAGACPGCDRRRSRPLFHEQPWYQNKRTAHRIFAYRFPSRTCSACFICNESVQLQDRTKNGFASIQEDRNTIKSSPWKLPRSVLGVQGWWKR